MCHQNELSEGEFVAGGSSAITPCRPIQTWTTLPCTFTPGVILGSWVLLIPTLKSLTSHIEGKHRDLSSKQLLGNSMV